MLELFLGFAIMCFNFRAKFLYRCGQTVETRGGE